MQPSDEDARRHLIQRADALEKSLDQTEQSMVRTEHLIALVEEIANDLYQLAEDWDPIDPQRAERWRAQEQQIRALSEEFAHLEELEAKEAKSIIATLRSMAHRAQRH
jgi:DNA repair exonuclease SbcCD ATPase subunit